MPHCFLVLVSVFVNPIATAVIVEVTPMKVANSIVIVFSTFILSYMARGGVVNPYSTSGFTTSMIASLASTFLGALVL